VKTATFRTGEVARIELVYEKLLKVSFLYKRLTHDQSVCSYQVIEGSVAARGKTVKGKEQPNQKGKGKGKLFDEGAPSDQPMQKKSRISSSKSAPAQRTTSAKDRPNWNGKHGGISASQSQQIWRPTGRVQDTPAKNMAYQGSEDLQTNLSKKSRSSTSGGKSNKRARVESGESKQHSPFVFERLGNLGDGALSAERRGSNEKTKHSPLVFERLGSQGSSSSTHNLLKSGHSEHSAGVAAQVSNHSASSVAANRPNSSGTKCGNESDTNFKEGLMGNSNPSKSQ